MSELSNKIESILFYSSEPVSINYLVKILDASKNEIESALAELSEQMKERGIRLLEAQGEFSLVTAPEHSAIIEKIVKEERERDLGRAGIETLAIIAYKSPVSKKEIEYIRGVNSQYALRNLLLRGLVERKASSTDERMIQYFPTADTLRFLGISKISDLPEYQESRKELDDAKLEESDTQEEDGNGEQQQ